MTEQKKAPKLLEQPKAQRKKFYVSTIARKRKKCKNFLNWQEPLNQNIGICCF